MRVGFIGLGNVGAPMAGFVLAAGFSLVVHDLRREAAAPLLERGAAWAGSPGEVAAQCDVVCTCVPGPPQMQAVMLGPGGVLEGVRPGAIVIDHTTALAMSIDLLLAECLTLGAKAGVSLPRLVEAFREGCIVSGNMTFTKRMPATLFRGDFAARFALALAYKDFQLAVTFRRGTASPPACSTSVSRSCSRR